MFKTVLLAALVALAPLTTAGAQQPVGRLEWGLGVGPVWPGPTMGVAIWGAYRVLQGMALEMGVGGFEREYPITPFNRDPLCFGFFGCLPPQHVDEPQVLGTGGAEVGLRAFRRLGPMEPFAGMGVGLYRSELDGPEELGPYEGDWGAGVRLGVGADVVLGPEMLGGSVRLGVEYRYLSLKSDFGQGEVAIGGSRASLRLVCVY